jgi:hypothetical protein
MDAPTKTKASADLCWLTVFLNLQNFNYTVNEGINLTFHVATSICFEDGPANNV